MAATVHIDAVFNITGVGPVPVGKVEAGTLRPGMTLNAGGKAFTVKRIEMHHAEVPQAVVGDNVGISFAEATAQDHAALKELAKKRVEFAEGRGAPSESGAPVSRPAPVSTASKEKAVESKGGGFFSKLFGKKK